MNHAHLDTEQGAYGLMAEFDTTEQVVQAADKVREAGYVKTDAFSPFPVHGLSEALGVPPTRLPMLVLAAGLIGCFSGYALEYFTMVIDYPINVGGRPLNSIPAFIPIAYECTILFSALTAALGMILLNGLPLPYHPVFNVERFKFASRDKFFICIESEDPKFDHEKTSTFLQSLNPRGVYEVDR
jgi:hypothetical protein